MARSGVGRVQLCLASGDMHDSVALALPHREVRSLRQENQQLRCDDLCAECAVAPGETAAAPATS